MRSEDHEELGSWSGRSRSIRSGRECLECAADLAHGLEHEGPRGLRRAIEARADGSIVEVVELPHGEGEALRDSETSECQFQRAPRSDGAGLASR